MLLSRFRSPQTLLAISLAIIIVVIGVFNENLNTLLRYDRLAVSQGEFWRIFSAHSLHLSWGHLWMNVAGLVMVFIFFGNLLSFREWLLCFFISSLGSSLLIFYLVPDVLWYVGLSGVLHGLFIAGGVRDLKVRRSEAIVFLIFICGKLLWEQYAGPLPGSEEAAGGPVLVDAHLYGAISGLISIVVMDAYKKQREH